VREKVVCKICLTCNRKYFRTDLDRCPRCTGPLLPVISLDEETDREFKRPDEAMAEEEF